MKGNAVFKRSYNRCLDLMSGIEIGAPIGSEIALSQDLEVSRTTVRTVQDALEAAGIIGPERRTRRLLRHPLAADYFAETEAVPPAELAERRFLHWMLGPDCRPGQIVNGLDLARQFGVSNSAIRDCLNRFAHLGLLERQTSGRWQALGLDRDFVTELFDMREIMEVRSVTKFVALPDLHPAWADLDAMEREHRALDREIATRFKEFSELDDRFHRLVGSISSNRFFDNIRGVMSLIFHYHYQWNKRDERERNAVAVQEHLTYIAGLKSRDPDTAIAACQAHLGTARKTLLASLGMAETA